MHEEIMERLGGRKFLNRKIRGGNFNTGLILKKDKTILSFSYVVGDQQTNFVTIRNRPNKLFMLEFYKIKLFKNTLVESVDNVQLEGISSVFEKVIKVKLRD